ncbi:MAG TPA: NADPH:quinone reductase [Micromonosporaceae bacterium]|nr:NADPH:quinone reductase [Micromonosporaceae bacterium]
MRVIQFTEFGSPDVLRAAELPEPVAGQGEVVIDVSSAGINFADAKVIDGSYLPPESLPYVPGGEVIGRDQNGRRLLAFTKNGGGYAERALVSQAESIEVPAGLSDAAALALLAQGLTAWHLLRTATRLREGESVVVHAAAGGVGSLLVQLAKHFGAGRVVAAASTSDKRDLALKLGADAAIDSDPAGYAERVIEANLGRKADIILDANGGKTFDSALDALGYFGRLVHYGNASDEPFTPIDPERLGYLSACVGGFWIRTTLALPGMFAEPLAELLSLTEKGILRPVVGGEYPLGEASTALTDLLARRTVGKLTLRPDLRD